MRDPNDPWRRIKWLAFVFPLILMLIFLGIKCVWPTSYVKWVQEDGFIENAQAVTLAAAAFISIIICRHAWRGGPTSEGLFFAALGLGLLVAAMEEISWMQRVFNWPTPDFLKGYSWQEEISLHNLDYINPCLCYGYMIVGLGGALGWCTAGRFIPARYPFLRSLFPPWYLSSYFGVLFLVYFVLSLMSPILVHYGYNSWRLGSWLIWRDQEPAEFVLALGFLFYTVDRLLKSTARK